PPPTTYDLLARAILAQQVVAATYQGHRRLMCAHVLGQTSGEARCLVWQFAGGSASGLPEGGHWRCLAVDELRDVQLLDGPWQTGPTYDPQAQTCVSAIDVQADVARSRMTEKETRNTLLVTGNSKYVDWLVQRARGVGQPHPAERHAA